MRSYGAGFSVISLVMGISLEVSEVGSCYFSVQHAEVTGLGSCSFSGDVV